MTKKEAVKIIRKKHMPKALEVAFKAEGYEKELEAVYARSAQLFTENKSASKALRTHLNQILPCIAFYEALLRIAGSKEEALRLYEEWAFEELKKTAGVFKKLLKTGLYKKVPDMFDKLIEKLFSSEAGFEHRAVAGAAGFARDTVRCPYFETCKKYGCSEITQFFCKSDDIVYGNMHPKLVWGRTQTLGTGGKCCDFRLYIKQD